MQYYFDNAATTKMCDEALEAYVDCAKTYTGNPSAIHSMGADARKRLEKERGAISNLLQIKPAQLFFTSGGTESNAIILSSLLWSPSPGEIIFSAIEHASCGNYARILKEQGWKIVKIRAPQGHISKEDLRAAITERTRMVCIQTVNNVVGSVQDIQGLVEVTREKEKEYGRKIHFHTDAVQALCKTYLDLNAFDVDSASFSAHKIHGPRGCGMLYLKKGTIQPLSKGGGQEMGVRPGTENLPAIVAMGKALALYYPKVEGEIDCSRKLFTPIWEINDYLREHLTCPILSPWKSYTPFILEIAVDPFPSEVFSRMLDDKGFCVSSGSACSNNAKQKGESILVAMGIKPQKAKSSIRLSFSSDTTMEETILLCQTINELYNNNIRK